jgi:glc operon protein GlcG
MMTRLLIAAALLALPAMPAWAQSAAAPTPAPTPAPSYGPSIRLDQAQVLIGKAIDAAKKRGFRMAVAVVEPSGELVAFARMDDTQYGSTFVAQKKAATAARYRTTTAAMEARVLGGRTVTLANPDSLPIAGGVPILVDGRIVGAIGVSGAAAAEDDEVAKAALEGR